MAITRILRILNYQEKLLIETIGLVMLTNAFLCISAKQEQSCNNEICNHEGQCTLENGKPMCQCIGSKYFQGPFCQDMNDNCEKNQCKNGAQCLNALGQYLCSPCPSGFSGQLCDQPEDQGRWFSGVYVHHNRYASLGSTTKFLFIVKDLGTKKFLLEFHTQNYAIEVFETDPSGPANKLRWQFSRNLIAVARSLGLRHPEMLPLKAGYYHITNARFWRSDLHTLSLVFMDEDSTRTLVSETYSIMIWEPKEHDCLPELQMKHCENQFEPLKLDIARFNIFEPIVSKRCSVDSALTFDWTLYNTIQTVATRNKVTLKQFPQTHRAFLKIPPHSLLFNYAGEVMQSYMLRISLSERLGARTLNTVARCYVFVLSKPVFAHIKGGLKRDVLQTQEFRIDGTSSRDFALPPYQNQKLLFEWNCKSATDPENTFCRKKWSNQQSITIRNQALKKGQSYTFTLRVTSSVNIYSSDSTSQLIAVVDEQDEPLDLDILCVRNCRENLFVLKKLLHLLVKCYNCDTPQSEPQFEWSLRGKAMGIADRLVYEPQDDEKSLLIKVEVKHGTRHGMVIIKLTQTTPPTKGQCDVEPKEGIAFETIFRIECKNFEQVDEILFYQYYFGDLALDWTTDDVTTIRLPEGDKVTITVCDSYIACTKQEVKVSISALKIPNDPIALKAFLQTKEFNIDNMIADGDVQAAMTLGYILMSSVRNLEMSVEIYSHFENLDLRSLIHIEQMLKIIRSSEVMVQPINHEKANLLAKMLRKVQAGLSLVVNDKEALEITESSYKSLTDDLTHCLSQYTVKWDELPRTQSLAAVEYVSGINRLEENYGNFTTFDIDALIRTENWLQSSRALHSCIQSLHAIATNMHHPSEEALLLKADDGNNNQLQMQMYSIEKLQQLASEIHEPVVKLHMSRKLVEDLQHNLDSRSIVLQEISTSQNPFWWYPNEHDVKTGVHYFSAASRKTLRKWRHSQDNYLFQFDMKLSDSESSHDEAPNQGQLTSNQDMAIYRFVLNQNALLIITFATVSIRMKVLLTLSRQPRGHMVRKSNLYVNPGNVHTLMLLNDLNSDEITSKAYMALLPAEDISAMNKSETEFVFKAVIHECLSWDFDLSDPAWSTDACRPAANMETTAYLTCHCRHMSAYSGRIFAAPSYALYNVGNLLSRLPVNWPLLLLHLLLSVLFFILALVAYNNLKSLSLSKTNLTITSNYDEFPRIQHMKQNVLMRINTGSMLSAGTTANIILSIYTMNGLQTLRIFQNPAHLCLESNTTFSIKLTTELNDTSNRPIAIMISHDNSGLYPSWYCRSIDIIYLTGKDKKLQRYRINEWLARDTLIPLPASTADTIMIIDEGKIGDSSNFRERIEMLFINWFQLQPLCGPLRFDPIGEKSCMALNRFQRASLWCCKVASSIFVVSCFFSNTNLENYEDEREFYDKPILPFHALRLLVMCISGYILSIAIQSLLGFYFMSFYR